MARVACAMRKGIMKLNVIVDAASGAVVLIVEDGY